jgi:hypothetical protein
VSVVIPTQRCLWSDRPAGCSSAAYSFPKIVAWSRNSRHDKWVNRARLLAVLAALSGGLCLATGLSYLTVSPTELTISALVTLGALGCCTLVAAGLWQARVKVDDRLPLVVLGIVAFVYSAGSALGFAGAQVAHGARLEPTALPSALHVAGLVIGSVLWLLVVAEFFRADSPRTFRPRDRSHPAR